MQLWRSPISNSSTDWLRPYGERILGRTSAGSTAEVPAKLERRIIARRAAMELRTGASVNFGFGIPGGIFGVIAEQGIEDECG